MSLDKRISELPLPGPIGLDDLIPLVNNGITTKVTLRQLIKELQINIPQPRIRIEKATVGLAGAHDRVYANWDGADKGFLKFNPEYWLYRYRPAGQRTYINKSTQTRVTEDLKKRFAHPSHQHGAEYFSTTAGGGRLYAGEQKAIVANVAQLIPGRNTEWAVANAPLENVLLDLEPWKYYRTATSDPYIGLPPNFSTTDQPYPRGGGRNGRFVIFKVRIAIDNPDPNAPDPKLFGPFSETFILYPYKNNVGTFDSFRYYLGAESNPRMRG